MSRFRQTFIVVLLLASTALLTSCGNDDETASNFVDLNVTARGIILRSPIQTCTDRATGTTDRSASANALSLSNLSITWKNPDLALYVSVIRVTIKSGSISGGKKVLDLDPLEIEAMFGEKGDVLPKATIVAPSTVPQTVRASTNPAKTNSFPACGLSVGGITLNDPNANQFTASVTIELIGVAQSDDFSVQKSVRKSITASATYY